MSAVSRVVVPFYVFMARQFQPILTELYIEALLVDEGLADQVWELWNAGLVPDEVAAWAWRLIAVPSAAIDTKGQFSATLGVNDGC